MSVFIESPIIENGVFSVLSRRNAGRNPSTEQSLTEPGGVIAAIRQKLFAFGQKIQEQGSAFIVADLSRREGQSKRFAVAVAYGMEF